MVPHLCPRRNIFLFVPSTSFRWVTDVIKDEIFVFKFIVKLDYGFFQCLEGVLGELFGTCQVYKAARNAYGKNNAPNGLRHSKRHFTVPFKSILIIVIEPTDNIHHFGRNILTFRRYFSAVFLWVISLCTKLYGIQLSTENVIAFAHITKTHWLIIGA